MLVIFFANKISAQDLNRWTFCFAKETPLSRVKASLAPFLLPKDKIYENLEDNCFQVSLSENRKELFEKQLRRNFNVNEIYKEANSVNVPDSVNSNAQCALDFTTKTKSDNQNTGGSVQIINGVVVDANKNENNSDTISSSQILVLSGKSASIQVDGRSVYVTCTVKGQAQAELSFSLANKVVSGSNSVSSTINLSEGQEQNVGGVVAQVTHNDSKVSTESGIDLNKSVGNQNAQYFIRLKKIIWN